MAKKVTLDNLPDAINEILSEYAGDVYDNLNVITKKIGQKGAEAVKNSAKQDFKGKKYYKGWGVTQYKGRLYTTVVIHNKKQPGLAHLLENGHVKANGTGRYGFYEGIKHILPVEQKLVAEYESEVINNL